MAWNPYTDQQNRAHQSIVTTLFPEQTKTLPRIIVWSIIFLLDLMLVVGVSVSFDLLRFDQIRTSNGTMLAGMLLLAATAGIFWLQGAIWYAIVKFFQKRKNLD